MPPSGPRPNAADILARVNDVLHGLELDPGETAAVLDFANQEVPHLQTPETSYLVLGSYREPFIRRVRIVENELNRRIGTYAFVLGDLRDLDIDRLPTFRIRFFLVASFADAIAAVYEQDAGGEVTELGTISETAFFDDSYVLPRDYGWMTDRRVDSEEAVIAAALRIVSAADIDDDEAEVELGRLLDAARRNGVEISEAEVRERVEARLDDGPDVAAYSWVQLNEFRLFELHGRCFPWTTAEELRSAVEQIP
jgi:hypothetical protein